MRHKNEMRKSTNFPPYRPVDKAQGAWIGYQLKLHSITQRDIAESVGVRPQFVAQVIYGLRTSARVQKAIANALGYETWSDLRSRCITMGVA